MRSTDVLRLIASGVVVGFCLFLIGLAVVIVTNPPLAERFLRSFASSARAHYTEQGLRLLVGAAIVTASSSMRYPELFSLFGWLIAVSSTVLLLLPWRWHHSLGTRVLPLVIRYMRFFALGAAALGVSLLYALSYTLVKQGDSTAPWAVNFHPVAAPSPVEGLTTWDSNRLTAYLAIAGLVTFVLAFNWFINRDLYKRVQRYFATKRGR